MNITQEQERLLRDIEKANKGRATYRDDGVSPDDIDFLLALVKESEVAVLTLAVTELHGRIR